MPKGELLVRQAACRGYGEMGTEASDMYSSSPVCRGEIYEYLLADNYS